MSERIAGWDRMSPEERREALRKAREEEAELERLAREEDEGRWASFDVPPEESGYIPEESGYVPEEFGYAPEEGSFFEGDFGEPPPQFEDAPPLEESFFDGDQGGIFVPEEAMDGYEPLPPEEPPVVPERPARQVRQDGQAQRKPKRDFREQGRQPRKQGRKKELRGDRDGERDGPEEPAPYEGPRQPEQDGFRDKDKGRKRNNDRGWNDGGQRGWNGGGQYGRNYGQGQRGGRYSRGSDRQDGGSRAYDKPADTKKAKPQAPVARAVNPGGMGQVNAGAKAVLFRTIDRNIESAKRTKDEWASAESAEKERLKAQYGESFDVSDIDVVARAREEWRAAESAELRQYQSDSSEFEPIDVISMAGAELADAREKASELQAGSPEWTDAWEKVKSLAARVDCLTELKDRAATLAEQRDCAGKADAYLQELQDNRNPVLDLRKWKEQKLLPDDIPWEYFVKIQDRLQNPRCGTVPVPADMRTDAQVQSDRRQFMIMSKAGSSSAAALGRELAAKDARWQAEKPEYERRLAECERMNDICEDAVNKIRAASEDKGSVPELDLRIAFAQLYEISVTGHLEGTSESLLGSQEATVKNYEAHRGAIKKDKRYTFVESDDYRALKRYENARCGVTNRNGELVPASLVNADWTMSKILADEARKSGAQQDDAPMRDTSDMVLDVSDEQALGEDLAF